MAWGGVRWIVTVLALMTAASHGATAPARTPAPTYDNIVINVSYVDLVSVYVVNDLFVGADQRYWRFLTTAARALTAAGYPTTTRSSLSPRTTPASRFTATIGLRPFSNGQHAIPYQLYEQYLITMIHTGTQQQLANTIAWINAGGLLPTLGVSKAHYLLDLKRVYSTNSLTGGGGSGQLSIGWHILLVLGVTLVYAIAVASRFRTRSSQKAGKANTQFTSEADDTMQMHAHRWVTDDLQEQQSRMLEEASRNGSPNASRSLRNRGNTAAGAADVTDPQLESCRGAIADVLRNDTLAQMAGTAVAIDGDSDVRVGRGEPDDGQLPASVVQQRRIAESWSLDRIKTLLDVDPALRLPPPSGDSLSNAATAAKTRSIVLGAKARARQARIEEEYRRAEAARRANEVVQRNEEETDDDMAFDLPPDELERLEREREEEMQQQLMREARPLGLAARRIARMMTTMAMDPNNVDPAFSHTSVHRSYTLGFNIPSQSPLAQRRSLRAAQFVPQDFVTHHAGPEGTGHDSDHSPSPSPTHSPGPERATGRTPAPSQAPAAAEQPVPRTDPAPVGDLRRTVKFADDDLDLL